MTLILSGTDGLSDVDGSAATPAIRGTDANTGIFFPAADTIAFSEGGTEAMRLDSAGNMGLGVTPSAWYTGYKAFQLTGDIGFASTGGALRFNNYINAGGSADIYYGNGWAGRYRFTLGNHIWDTAASGTAGGTVSFTSPMTLDASGNLGLGTSSPATYAGANGQLVVYGGVATTFTNCPTNITLVNNGTIAAGLGAGISFGANYNGSVVTTYATISGIRENATSGNSAGALTFGVRDSSGGVGIERARIDSSGNFMVGVTSSYLTSRLSIESANTNNAKLTQNVFNSAATSTSKAANTIVRVASNGSGADACVQVTDSVANNYFFGGNNGGAYVSANTNGVRLSNGGTSWASDSDERVKDIIEPITDAAEKVSSLRAVIGRYKTDAEDKRRAFLIAQDVQAVLPEAVFDEQGTLMLAYTETIPLLVAAIKEQQAIITQLQADVAALKGTP